MRRSALHPPPGVDGRKMILRRWRSCAIFVTGWAVLAYIQWFIGKKEGTFEYLLNLEPSESTKSIASSNSNSNLLRLLNDETNVVLPRHKDGTLMTLEERLRYLELKVNSLANFGTHPFFGEQVLVKCNHTSSLQEFGCKKGFEGYDGSERCNGGFDHLVCLDRLPQPRSDPFDIKTINIKDPPCLVYDFGIRANPEFGAVMARVFGCEVHAFDPSPISIEWWKSDESKGLRSLGNYHFHPYGAGGKDGMLTLHEYNWGQVSIIRYPNMYLDCTNTTADDRLCRSHDVEQKRFHVPVKTLPTIRKELGHFNRNIDILKVDVEGSEYMFLQQAFDTQGGCPDYVDQLSLEWHHMPWDELYGESSSPAINSIATLLHTCGLKLLWTHQPWSSTDRIYNTMGMHNIRYDLSTYMRER